MKEILKLYENFLKEREGYGRPEGPSSANLHHFQKVPRHKDTEFWPTGGKTFPYPDDKADVRTGDEATEEDFDDLPEALSELFKFTQSPSDNSSAHRPPTYGAGAMGSFGKIDVWDTGDSTDEEKLQSYDARRQTKIKKVEGEEDEVQESRVPNQRTRHTDSGMITTKEPWVNGMPQYDKKDIEIGDEVAENPEKNVVKEYADSDYSRMALSKIQRGPQSDLNFWDFVDSKNNYTMSDPDEEKEKRKNETKKKNRRSKT